MMDWDWNWGKSRNMQSCVGAEMATLSESGVSEAERSANKKSLIDGATNGHNFTQF